MIINYVSINKLILAHSHSLITKKCDKMRENCKKSWQFRELTHFPMESRDMFGNKSHKCIFIGYNNGYNLWNVKTKNIMYSQDVVFIKAKTIKDRDWIKIWWSILYKITLIESIRTT